MNYLATCSDVVRFWDASSAVSGVGAGVGASGGLELSRTCNTAGAPSNACCWNHSGELFFGLGGVLPQLARSCLFSTFAKLDRVVYRLRWYVFHEDHS